MSAVRVCALSDLEQDTPLRVEADEDSVRGRFWGGYVSSNQISGRGEGSVLGDFLGGGTVELAALSGLDLAERIGREPPRPLLRERPAPADRHRQEQPA